MNTDQKLFAYLVGCMPAADQDAIAPMGWPVCRAALFEARTRYGFGATPHAPNPRRILAMSRELAFRLLRS